MTSIPAGVPTLKTTEVMVILTTKQGVNREQIMKVMPSEIRATVKLYLEGRFDSGTRGAPAGVTLVHSGLVGNFFGWWVACPVMPVNY